MKQNNLRIFVVDDERPIRRFLRTALSAKGYQVNEAATGMEALATIPATRPDLIILDLGLPDMDGVEITQQIREWSQVPIIILSVRDREMEKVKALDAGADDYITKPFSVEELLARMRVALRRNVNLATEGIFQIDDLVVDLTQRRVKVGDSEINLTPTEYDLLRALVQNAGKILTHNQLLHKVWGNLPEEDAHLLRATIHNLRRKIEPDPSQPHYILTLPGVGYRLRIQPEG